jgi:mono/diheme cytochrome c family protein
MPVWEDILTEEEIWAVVVFLYEQTGATPRTWAEAGEGSE